MVCMCISSFSTIYKKSKPGYFQKVSFSPVYAMTEMERFWKVPHLESFAKKKKKKTLLFHKQTLKLQWKFCVFTLADGASVFDPDEQLGIMLFIMTLFFSMMSPQCSAQYSNASFETQFQKQLVRACIGHMQAGFGENARKAVVECTSSQL